MPEGSRLAWVRIPRLLHPRASFQRDLEGHLKALLRQSDLVLETALGKDGIKQFGGKHTPAT